MRQYARHIILCLLLLVPFKGLVAQEYEQMLANAMNATPGKERASKLVDISTFEREKGRYKEAVEFAILGSNEAERSGQAKELSRGLIELSKAHRAKGDFDNAIGACLRATMVGGTFHSAQRTEALVQLAELYLEAGHPLKAMEHLEDARSTTGASRLDKNRLVAVELKAKSRVLDPLALIIYCKEQQGEVVKSGDREVLLDLLSTLATAQSNAGQHQAALNTEEEVMKLAIALDKPMDAAVCANNMGELNQRMGRNEEALVAYGRGLIMVEDVPLLRARMQINAAHAQARSGNHASATRSIGEAERYIRKNGYDQLMPRLLTTKAAVLMLQGEMITAQNAALDALTVSEVLESDRDQAKACQMLASIFDQRDLAVESRNFQKKAKDIEARISAKSILANADHDAQLLRLQRIEREQSDLLNREQRKEGRMKQLALDAENREKQMALLIAEKQLEEAGRREQSFLREKADKELQLMQAAFESERQDRMIQELDNNRMLQSLNVTKLEYEQKEQYRALEILEKRNQLVEAQRQVLTSQKQHDTMVKRYSIMGAIAAVILSMYMAWAWMVARKKRRTIQRQNEKIQGINEELAEKNQNIQSSLCYAQTIQSAILPTEEDLQQTIPDSFLFYKPLDIVSGDLPFMKRVRNKVYIAAIDCTGHGVPAAMMTFIAYYGLSELIAQDDDLACGTLLDRLHIHVKKTMDARGEESLYNDGFDIGLCRIDLDTGELSFAGAQLPLLLVRNGEVDRIKGDVLPLGDSHFARKGGYKDHQLQLLAGDSIYLFSDGIIHQFGGEDGRKKFSMKKLSELLVETADMDLMEVKGRTEQEFLDWKGDTPQTDDVLLIGLRYAA